MNEIYKHRKGGTYQVVGRGTISVLPGDDFHDEGIVAAAVQADGSWQVHSLSPGVHTTSAHLQISKGYKVEDGAAVVIYRGMDARLWVRLEKEFMDGRFVKMNEDGTFPEHKESVEPTRQFHKKVTFGGRFGTLKEDSSK